MSRDTPIGLLNLQAGLAERLGATHSRKTESLDSPLAENQVACGVPLLTGLNHELDRIKLVKINELLDPGPKTTLDNDSSIRQPVALDGPGQAERQIEHQTDGRARQKRQPAY